METNHVPTNSTWVFQGVSRSGVTLHSTAGTLLHDQLVRRLTIMLSGGAHVTRPDILDARKRNVLSSGASHSPTRLLTCVVCPCKKRVSYSLWVRSILRSADHHHVKRTKFLHCWPSQESLEYSNARSTRTHMPILQPSYLLKIGLSHAARSPGHLCVAQPSSRAHLQSSTYQHYQ